MFSPTYPRKPRPKRSRRRVVQSPPPPPPAPPVALTLVSAAYFAPTAIRLTFDRAIDVSAMDVSQVTVKDGPVTGLQFAGTGAPVAAGVNAVDVFLVDTSDYAGADVLLSATAFTGIVALDDGGTWAGVENMVVPA